MDPGLANRLARRRELLRRQRLRRRVLIGVLLLLAVAAGALFAANRSGPESPGDGGKGSDQPARAGGESPASAGTRDAGARPGPDWRRTTGPVPILMYHVIGEPAGEVAYPDLYLSTADFRDQVRWLRSNGYTAVTLSQVQDAWFDGGKLPPRPIVLSFDDGYLGQYLDAMPVLRRAGWAGLLNLKAEGSDLSVRQVRKMIRNGWEVGSHTITHPDLRDLEGEALTREVSGSKRMLERKLGVEIENFCYPAGMYDQATIRAVEDAGYRGATTVNPGLAERTMPFELNRIRIDRGDGAEALATKLSSAGS
ncbi:MAG: polysaccharide deacetylase family protein [Solirubrobacterales bacterium]|nr:polysaccharide deacetylase family protein [Solirubrobacterales bacterium]